MKKISRLSWKVTDNELLKFAVILMCVSGMLQSSVVFSSWTIVIDGMKYMVPIIGVFIVFLRQHTSTRLAYIVKSVLISSIILLTCFLTNDFSFLLVCIILMLSRSLKINDFIRINLRVLVIFSGLQICLWVINYIINLGYPIYYYESERRISFLFTHPNIAALKLGWGVVMYVWIKWDDLKKKDMIGCFIAVIILYITTKADSCIIILFFLFMVMLRKVEIIKKVTILFSKYGFILLGIFTFLMAKLYENAGKWTNLVRKLDILFNRRFAMSYLAIKDNGLSVIGQTITMNHDWDNLFNFGNYTIDSLYIYFYVCIGIFYFLLIGIGFMRLAKYQSYKVALVVILFSLFAMIEIHCLYLSNCFVLLLLKCVIFNKDRVE